MPKTMITLLALAFCALSSVDALAQQRGTTCQVIDPYPRLPFALTAYTKAVPSRTSGSDPTTETPFQIINTSLLPSQTPRYLTIESISIKGAHPANAYLAIELRAGSQADIRFVPPRATAGSFATYPRHFLYQKFETTATPIHIRQDNLKIPVVPGAAVYIGIQNSATAAVEAMAVTITGTATDACLWGK
jgi:hypothetical protein